MSKKSFEGIELPSDPNLPPWIITPKEEKLIFDRWRTKTFARCDELIKAYVECSNKYGNPVEGMKHCKEANDASMGCVAKYQKQKYLDIERDILIEEKKEKRQIYEMYREKKRREAEQAKAAAKSE
ncbi:uncharacterized protein SPAPADRAFT_60581 [Spathaspora passalidarum NRRL Y-27907]|uniref:COX assembly mitochondrial protein n=1 Tax=Spathaspora passalidarum (strain NRRL Y-27907 / 11-Y1) TaxID=619300 RepID=G3ALJ9_SPAPN|nr:uncharacterized protein SPAPADRAFT_60581 [Spathaspora passalidarum NRRL Y-27907]EGW33242.1 hypothetical protein SPAPADRAFT_60581 [Spathaspora passalidarum NRRL Y-27907]